MSKIKEATDGLVADVIVWAIGWVLCMTALVVAFSLGRWAAARALGDISPDAAGLLSALAVVWLYEHRHFDEKLDRMR